MDKQDWAETLSAVVVGIVLGVLLAAWVVSPGSRGDDDRQARLTQAPPLPAADRSVPDETQRCLSAGSDIRMPLRRAASSISRWEIHVGAMNKLVVGAITLHQANRFWNRTRMGARHEIATFDRAWARLERHGVDCPPPDRLPARAPRELRSCAAKVSDDLRVLRAARTAIDTWRRHVRAMEMLRMGSLSPSTATTMWLRMWHRGQHEVHRYRAAAEKARQDPGCPSVMAPPRL